MPRGRRLDARRPGPLPSSDCPRHGSFEPVGPFGGRRPRPGSRSAGSDLGRVRDRNERPDTPGSRPPCGRNPRSGRPLLENCTGCQKPVTHRVPGRSAGPGRGAARPRRSRPLRGEGPRVREVPRIIKQGSDRLRAIDLRSVQRRVRASEDFNGEFDPGSGRTLAAGLTHASRGTNRGACTSGRPANG